MRGIGAWTCLLRPPVRWRAALALLLAGVLALAAPARAAEPEGVLTLDQARFEHGGDASRRVALPHTWGRDGLPTQGQGRYGIEFDLPRLPDTPWALAVERLSSRHAVYLNGTLIQDALDVDPAQRGTPVPALIDLPPALLRSGRNQLDIVVSFDVRAGMSPLRLGPRPPVQAGFAKAQTWLVAVPQAVNVLAGGLALFLLTVWWRRRSEREVGTFCGLMVAVSLRNVMSTGSGNQWHGEAADFALYALQVLTVLMLARFAFAFSRVEAKRLRQAIDACGVLLLAGGGVAAVWGALVPWRIWAYPVLLVLVVPVLWLLAVGARRTQGTRQIALVLAIVLLAGAATHDYFYLRGVLSVMDRYWMPLTAPVALLVFAWSLLDRFVGALSAVESHASELERRIAERTQELALANAAKTRFLAAASHDLRQPVMSISLLVGLLREQGATPRMHQVLEQIGNSVQALNSLLKGLLDLSRLDAGAVEVRRVAVPLQPLLERVVGDEREHARRKGIDVRLRAPAWAVESDPVLLEQILRNLVGNAVRYTEAGGVLVAARRRAGAQVVVQVWDTGPGIPAESLQLVFEEFVQLDNRARERSRGLGLGLSLVRRVAALLDAPIAVRSRPGRGSCFEVSLPYAGSSAEPPREHAGGAADLGGHCVWVVEDDAQAREALRLRLSGWQARVRAFDSASALERALDGADAPPDLLVSDQRLPDGSGVEIASKVLGRHARAQVLIITGDTAPDALAVLRDSGLPVLHKPFTSDELLTALRTLLAVRELSS